MIEINGYRISQGANSITISLPQTLGSLVDTVSPLSLSRKSQINNEELAQILKAVILMYEPIKLDMVVV